MRKILIVPALVLGLWTFCQTTPANAIAISFNSLAEQLLIDQHDDLFDGQLDITNNTGVTWTDFHLLVVGELENTCPACAFFPEFGGVPAGGYDGTAYEGPGTATVSATNHASDTIDIVGLNIADGAVLSFLLDVDNAELLGDWNLFGTPTTDGDPNGNNGAVPEPTSLALFAVGLVGLGFAIRRRRVTN